jgi:hypothetical protein
MSALNDLMRKFKRAAAPTQPTSNGKEAFDWEPERVMPARAPKRRESRHQEEDATPREPAPVVSTPAPTWKATPSEPSSVVGGTIPADVADFATVYKGASVQAPAHGYGVDRVGDMLAHKSLAGLDKTVRASAVLAALDAAGVAIAEVIHDGLLRYKALVAFEAAKELELHQVRPRNERRVGELKAAVESFQKAKQAEIDALTRESGAAAAALTRLETRQRAEEERFHRTVSLFVEPMPARVIPMAPPVSAPAPVAPGAPRTGEGGPPAEAKPSELKLVTPAAPEKAATAPAADKDAQPPKESNEPKEPKS